LFIIIDLKKIKNYFLMALIFFAVVFCLSIYSNKTSVVSKNVNNCYIAIIIDDFGNNSAGTNEMLSLPIKFTGAVMPSMSKTSEECELLFNSGKDVILHMPMEPHKGKLSWLGNSYILDNYTDEQVKKVFSESISQINHCVGVNNHMGSKVTENERIFNTIFSIMKENNLIFIDSVTTPKSIVEKTACENKIKYMKRDVFLDSTQDIQKIKQNIIKTSEIAKKQGFAIAIGHVGAEGGIATYTAIKDTYKELEEQGIVFVGVKDLEKIINNN